MEPDCGEAPTGLAAARFAAATWLRRQPLRRFLGLAQRAEEGEQRRVGLVARLLVGEVDDEREAADTHPVAGLEDGLLDGLVVDPQPVKAAQVADLPAALAPVEA